MNRRDFIKAGGSAFTIASVSTLFGAATPSKKMRLCVVGCARTKDHGKWFCCGPDGCARAGLQVMSRFAELKNCEITVLCDVDVTALDDAASVVTKMTGRTPAR